MTSATSQRLSFILSTISTARINYGSAHPERHRFCSPSSILPETLISFPNWNADLTDLAPRPQRPELHNSRPTRFVLPPRARYWSSLGANLLMESGPKRTTGNPFFRVTCPRTDILSPSWSCSPESDAPVIWLCSSLVRNRHCTIVK